MAHIVKERNLELCRDELVVQPCRRLGLEGMSGAGKSMDSCVLCAVAVALFTIRVRCSLQDGDYTLHWRFFENEVF